MRDKLKAALRHAHLHPGVTVRRIGDGYYVATVATNGTVRRGLADDRDEAIRRAK